MTAFAPIVVYRILLGLSALVAFTGLFVPLMDNDAAHHAVIAMRMHLVGDYVNLIDNGQDYLDKPHLHFWLAAASYKIFGLNSFAYKFPSFLFAILGVYSTYRLGARLYGKETGRLAALMIALSFGFLLSVSDVRMDAILVACIAFSLWQLTGLMEEKKWIHMLGSSVGLALGFATKGHIAVFVPVVYCFFYLLWKKDLKQLISLRWLVMVVAFFLCISPVLYCFYLQFNQHPEKIVRGESGINGVRFILWDQVFDRMRGKMEPEANHDPLFFFHSFLAAFAPWSILAFIAVADRLRRPLLSERESASALLFCCVLVLVTISSYQLPHYLNILFPPSAVLTAAFLVLHAPTGKWLQALTIIQAIVSFLVLVAAAVLNAWAFPVRSVWVMVAVILLLAMVFYFAKSKNYSLRQKAVFIPAASMLFFFFLANANFYPQLLQYQAGKILANPVEKKIGSEPVYAWKNTFSSSFQFYSQRFRKPFSEEILDEQPSAWLMFDEKDEPAIRERYEFVGNEFAATDFEVTMLTLKFLNPSTREQQCSKLKLARIQKKGDL